MVFAVVQVLFVAHVLQPIGQKGAGVFSPMGMPCAVFQVVHIAAKLVQAAHRAGTERGRQGGRKQGLKKAHFVLVGKCAQLLQGLVANATLWCGDGPQKRRVVVVVGPKPKPSAQVANFGPIKKTGAARHLVRDLGFAKRLLQHARLVVGAVKHRKVAPL